MSEVVLRCRDLHGGYARHTVLRSLSFELEAGRVLALLGPNGAGKTTALMTMAGFLPILGGSVEVLGEPIPAKAPYKIARRGLAYVPDDRALFKSLTVGENLKAARRGREAVDLALEYFPELRKRLNVRAAALSGGEQQMLVIARGLVTNPKVLMIDELSMGLAPAVVAKVLPVVRKIADDTGTAVLLVEQHVQQALAIADRAIVLVHGDVRMDEDGATLRADSARLERAYLGDSAGPHSEKTSA